MRIYIYAIKLRLLPPKMEKKVRKSESDPSHVVMKRSIQERSIFIEIGPTYINTDERCGVNVSIHHEEDSFENHWMIKDKRSKHWCKYLLEISEPLPRAETDIWYQKRWWNIRVCEIKREAMKVIISYRWLAYFQRWPPPKNQSNRTKGELRDILPDPAFCSLRSSSCCSW